MSEHNSCVGKPIRSSDALSVFGSDKKIEVLSPAGGPDSIEAAVRSGADAVYFGAGNFNARRNAKNFSVQDLKTATEYARIRGVKVYLTLNTLVGDGERKSALDLAYNAAMSGVNALIVQDLGIARLLKTSLPEMPLHASTQMSVHSYHALEQLKNLGFCRVVPAREMDKESLAVFIKEANKLGIEVEVFVHGALCMCLSGQCYLSALLGGRSGNRGLCAQPCRLPFSAENGLGHDLSLKDMSLINHIETLKNMGVASLKIEGRMKRPEYVAAATAMCRAAVDGAPASQNLENLLSGIFSRNGHTDGYFTDSLGKQMFGTRTETDEKISAGLIKSAHELYRRERQSVAVTGEFTLKENQPATLYIKDFDGNGVTAMGQVPETAKTKGVSQDSVTEKLSKLGGTPYYLKNLNCNIDEGLFISGGNLNTLKEGALQLLTEKRAKNLKSAEYNEPLFTDKRNQSGECKMVAQFRSVSQIPDDLSGIDAVILPVECDFSKVNLPKCIKLLADLPRGILHNGERYEKHLKNAKEYGVLAAVAGNLAGITMTKNVGLPFVAGFGMNVFNSDSVETLKNLGASACVLSFELNIADAVNLGGDIPRGVFSYGKLPLMCFRNCPIKNGGGSMSCGGKGSLTDRKGISFPVSCRGEFSEMFNSVPLWMFDRKKDIEGIDFNVLYFTDEDKERCQEIIAAKNCEKAPDTDYTRGLYYRGVI